MKCEDCSHAEMCKWIDELEGRGCDFGEPCEDAISLDAVIEWLKEKDFIKMSWQEENARKELQEYFPVTPSRRKGRWILDEDKSLLFNIYKCSNCENIGARESKYCPNCGAEMEGEE